MGSERKKKKVQCEVLVIKFTFPFSELLLKRDNNLCQNSGSAITSEVV